MRIATAAQIAERCGSEAHQGICAEAGPYRYVDAAALLAARTAPPPAGQAAPLLAAQTDPLLAAQTDPLIIVLDNVQDPQNLGAIARTAECAGATGVVIHEREAAEVTPAACKASAGALEHLPVARVRNVADVLGEARRAGCWCYGAVAPPQPADRPEVGERERPARGPVSYMEPDYSGGVVIVLGSEGTGLRPRVAAACDQLITLPMRGRIGSLGVSAAAAAILYGILQDRAAGT